MSDTPTPPRDQRWQLVYLGLVVLVGGGLAWYFWLSGPKRDPVAAALANTRGIGLMEQFEYAAAVTEFEQVVKLDPDWLPGKINLGIALLNTADTQQGPANLKRALDLFAEVLKKEPKNAHAHYSSGMIHLYKGNLEPAAQHFTAVTEIDPNDPHGWYHRGLTHPDKDTSPEAKRYYRKALDLNPAFNAARYAVAQHRFEYDLEKSKALFAEQKALIDATWETEYKLVYTDMGRYAECIGKPARTQPSTGPMPVFQTDGAFAAKLADGVRWAQDADLDDLGRAVQARFGATLVQLDYDGDGKPDLLLLSAVVRGGKLADVLLRNDGLGKFTDVTDAVGLGQGPASLGCAVADFDNDGRSDLVLTGATGARLFRNQAGTTFTEMTAAAGLDKLPGVFLGAGWVDLDQDSDLDLLLARYATTPALALARLQGGQGDTGGGLVAFANTGAALPVDPQTKASPGLTCQFKPLTEPAALQVTGPVVTFLASDLDADKDLDLLVFVDGAAPVVILNDRLLRFQRGAGLPVEANDWIGGLVLDLNHDEQSDLLLLPAGKKPVLLLSQRDTPAEGLTDRFVAGATDAPPLRQAQATDLDRDGWADVVALSQGGAAVLLHNDGTNRLVTRAGTLGTQARDLQSVAVVDLSGEPDVLCRTAEGLQAWRNQGNGNRTLRLALTGRRDPGEHSRTNADGIGCRVTAHAGSLTTSVENTTLSAGLGQSRMPLALGLGKAGTADVVRIRWPDGVPQAELDLAAGEVRRLVEKNRKGTSCPVLLTWDGTRYTFLTDFLGGGALGEMGADGSVRPPRPEESVKIEPGRLVPRNGRYALKIAEPMDEVLYLDHLRLDVIDHPAAVAVHPDERFATSGPQPSQELLAFRARFLPRRAVDQRGRDVTATLAQRDGRRVDGYRQRAWLGFTEEHFVELDFGDQLAKLPADQRLYLVLAGWIDYPYPESIYAAEQAGVAMLPPLLEKLGADGKWQTVGDIGFPAGLPRVMTVAVSGLAGSASCRLRLRTNLVIGWDHVYLAPVVPTPQVRSLAVAGATLAQRGFMQEITPRGGPTSYDDDRTDTVAVTRWRGRLTRTGDVTELLARPDDRFVLCGPGDEIVVEFDATQLPPLAEGHVRSFVLRTFGYCKDTSPFTRTGGSVEPLPFRAMKSYPPAAGELAPAQQEADRRRWHTRPAGR